MKADCASSVRPDSWNAEFKVTDVLRWDQLITVEAGDTRRDLWSP